MTKLQLRNAIKREARVQANANLDPLIDDIVVDILRDFCNLARYHELLKVGVAIPLVDHQQAYQLPADCGNLAVLRYGRGPVPHVYRELMLQTDNVRQTSRNGYPRFYRFIQGNQISFWPYYDIAVADELLIDYYVDPLTLFVLDTDVFPVDRLESAVKKAAIARVQRFHSSNEEANMTQNDTSRSFSAADGAA